MPSLLDQAIEVGKQLEGSDQRLAAVKTQIAQAEATLSARQQELTVLERETAQRMHSQSTEWEHTRRVQLDDLTQRRLDIEAKEAALKLFPIEAEKLRMREDAVKQRETDAESTWQRAKEAELTWTRRQAELDARAVEINAYAAQVGAPTTTPTPAPRAARKPTKPRRA